MNQRTSQIKAAADTINEDTAVVQAIGDLSDAIARYMDVQQMIGSASSGLEVPNLAQHVSSSYLGLALALDKLTVLVGTLRRANPEWKCVKWEEEGADLYANALACYNSSITNLYLQRATILGEIEKPFERAMREAFFMQGKAIEKASKKVIL